MNTAPSSTVPFERARDAHREVEYGCEFRRVLPWGSDAPSETGLGVSVIAPGESSQPHSHDDWEQFLVTAGTGAAIIDGALHPIERGDAFVISSQREHYFVNPSTEKDLELVSVWSVGPFGGTNE
ncbi:cupin domain-containing protein [Pseudarthrobacter oxydans]|uniref:cupin domain-containing protein n=1 Tax=Pseudarthrobacter oxydans TaxID=1671 RepID=UPI00343A65A2